MAKQSAGKRMERWWALDAALSGPGLNVKEFARARGVSTRTVRRDLAAFAGMGQELRGSRKGHDGKWWWTARPPLLARTYLNDLARRLGRGATVEDLERDLPLLGDLLRELRAEGMTPRQLINFLVARTIVDESEPLP